MLFHHSYSLTALTFLSIKIAANAQVSSSYTCQDAIEVQLGETPYDTTDAPSNPVSLCSSANWIVWYKWTATFTGFLQASNCGTATYDTVIAVFSACTDFPTSYLNCADDGCQGAIQSNVIAPVTEGQTYYLAVGGYYVAGTTENEKGPGVLKLSQADLKLDWVFPALPLSGGPAYYFLNTTAIDQIRSFVAVLCVEYSGAVRVYTSSSIRGLLLSQVNFAQQCTAIAVADYEVVDPELLSNAQTFYYADEMTLAEPAAGATLINGAPFSILVTTDDPSVDAVTKVTFTCGGESETIEVTANEVKADAVFTNPNLVGDCKVMAVTEPVAYATYSYTLLTVVYPLTLKAVPTTTTAGSTVSYSFVFNEPTATEPIDLKLTCEGSEVQSMTVSPTTATQSFVVDNSAKGQCSLQAFRTGDGYPVSNSVAMTVYQQLVLASSLQGWTGGQSVSVLLTSPEGLSFSTELVTTCSIGSYSQSVITASTEEYTLPSTLNGIDCLLSTPGSLPDYYLPLQQTLVRIAMSEATSQNALQSLCPACFVRAVIGCGTAGRQQQSIGYASWTL